MWQRIILAEVSHRESSSPMQRLRVSPSVFLPVFFARSSLSGFLKWLPSKPSKAAALYSLFKCMRFSLCEQRYKWWGQSKSGERQGQVHLPLLFLPRWRLLNQSLKHITKWFIFLSCFPIFLTQRLLWIFFSFFFLNGDWGVYCMATPASLFSL